MQWYHVGIVSSATFSTWKTTLNMTAKKCSWPHPEHFSYGMHKLPSSAQISAIPSNTPESQTPRGQKSKKEKSGTVQRILTATWNYRVYFMVESDVICYFHDDGYGGTFLVLNEISYVATARDWISMLACRMLFKILMFSNIDTNTYMLICLPS